VRSVVSVGGAWSVAGGAYVGAVWSKGTDPRRGDHLDRTTLPLVFKGLRWPWTGKSAEGVDHFWTSVRFGVDQGTAFAGHGVLAGVVHFFGPASWTSGPPQVTALHVAWLVHS